MPGAAIGFGLEPAGIAARHRQRRAAFNRDAILRSAPEPRCEIAFGPVPIRFAPNGRRHSERAHCTGCSSLDIDQHGACERTLDFLVGELGMSGVRTRRIDQNDRPGSAGSGNVKLMLFAVGIEQKRQQSRPCRRRCAWRGAGRAGGCSGFFQDDSGHELAACIEPGDIENARRWFALAVQKMPRAQRGMLLPQGDELARQIASVRGPASESAMLQSNQEISLSWQ